MKHPPSIWTDPFNAEYPLAELRDAYAEYLQGRTHPTSRGTVGTYTRGLLSFEQSLAIHGEPLVLSSLTPSNVERWIADLRRGNTTSVSSTRRYEPCGEETIGVRLSILKTFTHKFIYRHLEMTHRDLLERVERYNPPTKMKAGLTQKQLEQVLGCFATDSYQDVRDRALVAFYAASGLRFSEVLFLSLDAVDVYSGWAHMRGKGDKERQVRLGERALKALRAYLRHRRAAQGVTALWTGRSGQPLTYWGGQSIFRRLKTKSGLDFLHAHRFRHTWTQTALEKGAERALVQDAMGWESHTMVAVTAAGYVRGQRLRPCRGLPRSDVFAFRSEKIVLSGWRPQSQSQDLFQDLR